MGIGYGQAGALRKLLKNDGLDVRKLSVCDLGSQKVFPAEVNRLLNTLLHGSNLPGEQLYTILGFAEYTSIDLDGADGARQFDLGKNLQDNYGFSDQFDLVTNFGTAEHVFAQAEFFANMHSLTKPGGLMLHSLPSRGWKQHGFYRYDDVIVEDLAKANGYEIVYLNSANRYWPRFLNLLAARIPKVVSLLAYVLSLVGLVRRNSSMILVFKKGSDAAFVSPVQGMYSYLKDIPSKD